jgi:hypothetical protein
MSSLDMMYIFLYFFKICYCIIFSVEYLIYLSLFLLVLMLKCSIALFNNTVFYNLTKEIVILYHVYLALTKVPSA